MRTTARFVFSTMASITALTYGAPVMAQTVGSVPPTVNDTTQSRTALPNTAADNTDYEPVGARFGSFMLYPKVETSLIYNDNIYALANKTDDFISKISPSIDFRGDMGVATAALRASVDHYEYWEASRESRTDWSVGANASIEAKRGTFFYGAGGFSRAHEDRGDPNAVYTDRRPTEYSLTEGGAGFSTTLTRAKFGLDASYRNFDYRDNQQLNGFITNNDDRDKGVARIAGRAGFEFSPGYSLLARLSYETVNYRLALDDAGFDRESHGWRGTIGVNFELSNLLEGEIWGGYLTRSYDDARFPKIESAVFGSSLTWHPTPMTAIKLNVDRNVNETQFPGYRGFLSTTGALGIEHEFLPNLKFSAEGRYGKDTYKLATGAAIGPRSDDNYAANASIKYLVTRNVYAKASYDWSKRSTDSNFPGIEFSRNRVSATIGLQF
ncbi:MAG: outer membrane beta-barrel protein [Pseudomonadota bacterium]